MQKTYIQTGILFCALSVILGAFAAHALKKILPNETLIVFETGVKYQFYHGLAIILTGIIIQNYPSKYSLWAGRLFIAGIILFSGSLYTLSLLWSDEKFRILGMITPFGGVLFITGWLLLLKAVSKKNN